MINWATAPMLIALMPQTTVCTHGCWGEGSSPYSGWTIIHRPTLWQLPNVPVERFNTNQTMCTKGIHS